MPKFAKPRVSNYFGCGDQPCMGGEDTWLEPESLTYPSGSMIRHTN